MGWMPESSTSRNERDYRRKAALFALIVAALVCLLAVGLAGGASAPVSAQISPLSPMYAVGSNSPALSLTSIQMVNVMASGQTALTRLSLVLAGVIIGAGVLVWRRP